MKAKTAVSVVTANWKVGEVEQTCIRQPEDIYRVLQPLIAELEQEAVCAIALNIRNKIIGVRIVTLGTSTESLVAPKETFRDAILLNASGLILAHNHPSGDPSPSAEDLMVTRRMREAGVVLGIELLDHMIVTRDSYCSLKTEGLM